MPISCFLPNSSKKLCSQIISFAVSVATTYLASVVDKAAIFCKFEALDIVVPLKVNTKPVVLFLLSKSLTKSTSTKPYSFKLAPVKQRHVSDEPLRYLRIHLIAFQCCFPGLLMYLLTTPTACAIYGLIHAIAYIKLPIAEA